MSRSPGLTPVYLTGVAQGLALVAFPAASAIFTSPHGYGFSATRYGTMFVPQVILAILASALAPKLAKTLGLKQVLMSGMVADMLAMALLTLSWFIRHDSGTAFLMLLAATGALGFGFGAAVMALNTLAELLAPGSADRAVLTLNALLGTGTALAPLFVALFVGLGAWWIMPIVVGGTLLALLLMIAKQPLGFAEKGGPGSARPGGGLPAQFTLFASSALLYGIVETLNANWSTLYLMSQRELSAQAASLALTAFWAMVTIGRLLFAATSSKVSARLIYVALPFSLAIVFQLVARASGELGGIVAFGLAGLACSAFLPLTISLAGREFPQLTSVMSGELIACYQVGYGIAAFGTGPLRQVAGLSFSTVFSVASLIAGALGVGAWLIVKDNVANPGIGGVSA